MAEAKVQESFNQPPQEAVKNLSLQDKPKDDAEAAQDVNPWSVDGAVVDGVKQAIDYDKLIDQFGTKRISPELIEKFERITNSKAHHFLRRGHFFSHRYEI